MVVYDSLKCMDIEVFIFTKGVLVNIILLIGLLLILSKSLYRLGYERVK